MGSSISRLLFQPPRPALYEDSADIIKLKTSRGQSISAFYLDNSSQLTLLFSHGNAEDLGLIRPWFKEVARCLRINVFAYDYTGYGLNESEPSEADCCADVEAAFEYLTDVLRKEPSSIILYGRSLGSGPSCHLALRQSLKGKPVGGMVLQSPLLSAYRVAFHFRFSLPGDQFCNVDKVNRIRNKVLIIHGMRDEIVPFWHGQELYLALHPDARYQPFWVRNAGHNNIESLCHAEHLFFPRLKGFVQYIMQERKERDSAQHQLNIPSPSPSVFLGGSEDVCMLLGGEAGIHGELGEEEETRRTESAFVPVSGAASILSLSWLHTWFVRC